MWKVVIEAGGTVLEFEIYAESKLKATRMAWNRAKDLLTERQFEIAECTYARVSEY